MSLDRLLESAVSASQHPEEWPAALRTIAEACNADHGFLYLVRPDETIAYSSRGSEEIFDAVLRDDWQYRNPRMARGLSLARQGRFDLLTDFRCFTPEEISRDPFEQEFAKKHDILHYAGGFIPGRGEEFLVLSMERRMSLGPFVNVDLEKTTQFFQLFSLSMRQAFQAQLDFGRGVIEALGSRSKCCAWIGACGTLIHASAAFEQILGKLIRLSGGKVHAADPRYDTRLQWLLEEAAQGRQPTVSASLRGVDGSVGFASVLPMKGVARDMPGSSDIMLTVVLNGLLSAPDLEDLQAAYGLSRSEARLALRLAAGESLRKAAEAESVTFETARSRLKSIFHKTSTNRQVELVLLIQSRH